MKATKIILSVFLLLGLAVGAQAQDLPEFTRIVKELSSSKYQGRAYANNGVVAAGNYLEQEFRKAGADEVFQQPFKITINTFPGKMKASVDGRKLKAGEDFVMREYSPGAHGTYKLYHIDTANYDFERIKADLEKPENKGAMVVCDFWFPYTHREISKLSNCGIGGFVYTWSTPLKFYKAYGQKVVAQPIVWTTEKAVSGAKTITLDVDNRLMTNFESSNVVACVKGRRSDSCYVFTAHYDHLGNIGSKVYCPGVNDNASGTAAIVTLAQHYAKHQPEFDMWFLAFAGEETGLNGSTYFVENPAMSLGSIKYLFNLDMIADNNPVQYVEVSDAGMAGFAQLQRINTQLHLFDSLNKGDLAANSDHYPFAEKGVPCILFEQQDGDCFQYYHTPKDDMKHFCTQTYPLIFRLLTQYVSQNGEAAQASLPVGFNEGVELMAMVWRLMGDPTYNRTTYAPYCNSADEYFAPYKEHPVVAKARQYQKLHGIGFDAVASYGMHLVISPDGHLSFDENLVEGTDASLNRWSRSMQRQFLPLLEEFYRTSNFHQWYHSTEFIRNQAVEAFGAVKSQLDLPWFENYFGHQAHDPQFGIVLSILSGVNNYGIGATMTDGTPRITPVISCCFADGQGKPYYPIEGVLPTVVHEFCHPYCNPLNAQHWSDMKHNAAAVYKLKSGRLKAQAYTTPKIMMDETFVRSCVIRYLMSHGYADKKSQLLDEPVQLGFLLTPGIVDALGRFEEQRSSYPSMADFMPEYIKVVNAFDAKVYKRAQEEAARNSATYTCNIADGATGIPSGLYNLVITFSKPMQPAVSLGMGRRNGAFPALARGMESVSWDESQTVLTVELKLEPNTQYSFSIMGENFPTQDGFTAGKTTNIDFTTGN